MKKLYLDDIRTPNSDGWDIVRNYEQFVDWIQKNGAPDIVSFDHDLADIHYNPNTYIQGFKYHEKTGYDCAKWLCEYCMINGLPMPKWNVHSANPVGKENIIQLLKNFEKKYSN